MATKVRLRRKAITNGRNSLYLDYYPPIRCKSTMKLIHKEYLGIYVYQEPQNEIQRDYNQEMLYTAEGICAKRIQSIINEEYGFLDKHKMKGDFLEYFKGIANKKYGKWVVCYRHFERFVNGSCKFGEVNIDLCRRFGEHLLSSTLIKNDKKRMMQNSAAGYFSTFRALLKVAFRDKMIRENVNEYLDKIDYADTKKEFLTLDEVKILSNTPCEYPILRKAAMFACFTGLRLSDVLALKWVDIVPATDGGYCMRIRTEKTNTEATLPISDEALEFCGERGNDKVFKGFQRSMAQHALRRWIKQSGINKNITFHCFRHTFATLQIAMGTDIFTVSKMLTHKNVSTTQIYAQLVNEKKCESANKITLK